jgi:glycosyltransferase involved in cell wall biosynthesis
MAKSLRKADVIVAISNFTKSEISSVYPSEVDKIEVVEGASSFNTVSSIETNTERYFLFVGTIEPRKNIERLLHAYGMYVSIAENIVPLKIVGAIGWGDVAVSQYIEDYGLSSLVECLECVADDELESLYKDAYALLMPSLYEGFGLPLVEAMNCGVPAIVSKGGALEEVGGDAVMLIDPTSVESIAEKITVITNNPLLRETLSTAALLQSHKYQWGRSAEKILTIANGLSANK